MKKIMLLLTLSGLVIGNFGCEKVIAQGAFITSGPSCRMISKSTCSDYSGSNPADLASYEKICPHFEGTWSSDGCPMPGPCRNDQQGIKVCDMQ